MCFADQVGRILAVWVRRDEAMDPFIGRQHGLERGLERKMQRA